MTQLPQNAQGEYLYPLTGLGETPEFTSAEFNLISALVGLLRQNRELAEQVQELREAALESARTQGAAGRLLQFDRDENGDAVIDHDELVRAVGRAGHVLVFGE